MGQIDYSVVIRTIGKAGEKYQKLLDAINGLVPQPKEVIVVLPEGYSPPKERLGWETFYYSQRGMVPQRITGIDKCRTRYALICDDDVSFNPDFVEKLYAPVQQGLGAFSVGPLYSFLPPKGANALACAIMATAAPTIFHKRDRYVSVLKSTGYSYNRHLKPLKFYETQSAAGTCFFADISKLKEVGFEQEMWLDANGYAAMEDQTMFYKAWLQGKKTIAVSDAIYEHMDAKTSTRNNKPNVLYSAMFNRVIFWHRFIYSMQKSKVKKSITKIAFSYCVFWIHLWNLINVARHRMNKEDLDIVKQGYADAKRYLMSDEYSTLPAVCKE